VRSIPSSYEELAADLLGAVDLTLEERAAEERERELDRLLEGRTVAVDGVACAPRVRGEVVILSAPGAKIRPLRLLTPEAVIALTAVEALEPRAAEVIAALRRGRQRIRLLRERERLREELRAIERRRDALERLREIEVRAADKLRRRLLRRERRRGARIEPGLERPVERVVLEAARRLAAAALEARAALERCEKEIFRAPPARGEAGDRLLAGLRELGRLLGERIALEYRRLERELLARFRLLAFGEGGDVAGPGDQEARRFIAKLAFLMAKANFSVLSRADLERGFEIGPAPGVRLAVPLDDCVEAYFFARGVKLEPLAAGPGLAPRFEKFAFCLLRGRAASSAAPPAPRPSGGLSRLARRLRLLAARRLRRHLLPRVDRFLEYARHLAKAPPPEVAVDPPLGIKIFRDVRLGECGLVLPGATIRYRWRDIFLVGLGAAGGVWSKMAERPISILLSPKIALSLFAVTTFRGLLGMRRSRLTLDKLREEYENRHLQATRMNAVAYFLREAAEADAKEVLVAYFAAAMDAIAARREGEPVWRARPAALLGRIETWLGARTRARVQFDIEDALGSLEGIGLVPGGFYVREERAPDYFDARLIGPTFQVEAEILMARPQPAPPGPAAGDGLARALARAAARDAAEVARRDAGRPLRGCDPLTNAPRWLPLDGEDAAEGIRFPAEEIPIEPLAGALRRLKRDLRARLGLDDDGPQPAEGAEPESLSTGRFTI
jgi:hypothetical protein